MPEILFEGPGKNWTQRQLDWLAKLSFDEPAARTTFEDYLGGVEVPAPKGRTRSRA